MSKYEHILIKLKSDAKKRLAILDGMSSNEQEELFHHHFDREAIEQWLIEYYSSESLTTLREDYSRIKRMNQTKLKGGK